MQRWNLLIVLCVALVCLATGLWLFQPWPTYGDEGEYIILADAYRAGLGHRMLNDPEAPVNLPAGPALPAYLALVQAVLGGGWTSAKLAILATFPLFGAALTTLLLRRFHPAWAAAAALMVCLSYRLAFFSGTVMTEIPFLLAVAVGLLAAERYRGDPRPRHLAVIVACIAVAYLLREAGIAFGLAMLVAMFVARRWRAAAVVCIACIVLPVLWHSALAVQAKRVGDTYGRAHLESFKSGSKQDSPAERVRALIEGRPRMARTMALRQTPELLRVARYYQRMVNGRWEGRVCSGVAGLFFLSSLLGAFFLVWRRHAGAAVGSFVLIYLAMLVAYRSYVRYLVPAYPFMAYAAFHFWDSLRRVRPLEKHRVVTQYAAGAAFVLVLHAVGLHGLDVSQQARRATRARMRQIVAPRAGRVAAERAAEWVGLAFAPRSEFIGARKELNAYVSSHQYTRRFPVTDDLGLFTAALDGQGITLLLEDDYTAESTGRLRACLSKGDGEVFQLLAAVYEGNAVARVWRYLGSGRGASPATAVSDRVPATALGTVVFDLPLDREGRFPLGRAYDLADAQVYDGVLEFRATGRDPQFELVRYPPGQGPAAPLQVVIEMAEDTPGETGRIYVDTGSGYSESQAVAWELGLGPGLTTYIVPIYLKPGEHVQRLRFDLADGPGSVRLRQLAVIRPNRLPW